ncbi:MAG: GTP cyclohydrolase I FolE [Acidimicrobiales bacterium]
MAPFNDLNDLDDLDDLVVDPLAEPAPLASPVDVGKIEKAVREILEAIGEDPDRDGLRNTPSRVARMYAETCAGLHEDPTRHLKVTFEANHDEMILVRDIPFYSLCEHHLVPFFGHAHVGYIPSNDGQVTGLSKLARLVEGFSRRPQVQERLTSQVANAVEDTLHPRGALVVIEAEHLCMGMRGIRKPGSSTVTSAVRGIFRDDIAARAEAMRFIERGR